MRSGIYITGIDGVTRILSPSDRKEHMKPIDTCPCPHHKLERSHRETTHALRCLVDAITVTKALPTTHINLVEAQRTLEQHGWQEKGE
jgi:hypothetical protein